MALSLTGLSSASASTTTQSCEFATYQYRFTGVDGTFRDLPGGSVIGTLRTGDLLNSGYRPSSTGWIQGNFYTAGGAYKGTGYALRMYFSYLRLWC